MSTLLARGAGSSVSRRPQPAGAWLLSERADFWVLSAGGGVLLIALALGLLWRGDRELSAADVLLGELHLGATYHAIVRQRLWRRMPLDVLAVPLAIGVGTYALLWHDGAVLMTTIILYLGAWHRGRQTLGIARHYQRRAGGPVSPAHRPLLSAAFYLPMIAPIAYYAGAAPTHEGDPFHHLSLAPDILWGLAAAAGASVVAYLGFTFGRTRVPDFGQTDERPAVHPAERWLVLANTLGFGSAYVLGAWTSSFVLVLAIHHEVQYLYFTYAVARHAEGVTPTGLLPEARRIARFALWPALGFASWAACTWASLDALDPFLTAGLLAHYWLDGRIWTARARSLAAVDRV